MTTVQRQQLVFWASLLVLFFLALHLLSGILLPFVAGFAIAYLLHPLVKRLEGWRVPRGLGTFLALLLFVLVLLIILALLIPLLQLQIGELTRRMPSLIELIRQQVEHLTRIAQERLSPEDLAKLREAVGERAADSATWLVSFAERLLTSGIALANLLSLVFITPIVSFFLLRDWSKIMARIDIWLPRQYAATIREQARLVDATLAGFVRGQFLVCVTLGVYYAVALWAVGLEFALVIGVLIGVLAFIPYVGFAIGFVLAMGLAMVQYPTWTGVIWVAAVFALGQVLESNFLAPKLVGERVHLHPVWVMFALLAFAALFGFVGVLLALPAAAVVGVMVRFALDRYMSSPLYDHTVRLPEERAPEERG